MKAIEIRTLDVKYQRHGSLSDWHQPYGMPMKILVSNLGDADFEFILAVRKLVEMHLCGKSGIPATVVDSWNDSHRNIIDPGVMPDSPYRSAATKSFEVAALLGELLNVDWIKFEARMEEVWNAR